MNEIFENNLILFISTFIVSVFAWLASSRIKNVRKRRAIKASVIMLAFPVVYLGHPVLFYSSWMILFVYGANLQIVPLVVYLLIWLTLIGVSLLRPDRERRDESSNEFR